LAALCPHWIRFGGYYSGVAKKKRKGSRTDAWGKALYEQRRQRIAQDEPRRVEPRPVKRYFLD
jgi:hypothetical protein